MMATNETKAWELFSGIFSKFQPVIAYLTLFQNGRINREIAYGIACEQASFGDYQYRRN